MENHRLSLALLLLTSACQSVPVTGRRGLMLVSVDQERGLGAQAYAQALKDGKLSTDAAAVARVRAIGARLAAAAERPDFEWEFNLLVDDKTINAWCLPGGKVAVYTGLLPVAKDDAGLAVVMGHEIAHALARHGAERMSQGMLAQMGGNLLSVAMSQQPAATRALFGQAYGAGVQVGALLPFSRAHESEADRIGLILMAKAGYDPEAAIAFWERMAAATGGAKSGSGLEKFLATHPSSAERVAQIRAWLPEARAGAR
jgi:predicted Zn-dependent protease